MVRKIILLIFIAVTSLNTYSQDTLNTEIIGTNKSDKIEYFENIKLIISKGMLPSLGMQQLIIFDKCEAKDIGYDVVVVLGSKKYLTKKDVIKRLKTITIRK